jgi:RNA polymerase sigma-70 factor (ECF subfamily)
MNCFEFADEWKKIEGYLRVFIGAMIFYPQERDDLLQNAALAMWKKIDAFDPSIASFKTWATGVARMECLNFMHSRKSSKVLFDGELLDTVTSSMYQEECSNSLYDNLGDCMLNLEPEKLEILKMKYNEHMSISEISLKMGISEAAVKEKLYRIRKELKSMIIKRKKAGN